MLDIDHEIMSFEQDMLMSGVDRDSVNVLVRDLRIELKDGIDNIVDYGLQQAEEAGIQMNADDFIKELGVSKFGSMYQVGTWSGKTDFTVPPFRMLPSLLRNAKIAKDGSLYKAIPVKQSTGPKTTENVMATMNKGRTVARDKKRAEKGGNVNFRIASSKQDPNTKWVHPGFKRDMTDTLRQINEDMNQQIDQFVRDTFYKYKGF